MAGHRFLTLFVGAWRGYFAFDNHFFFYISSHSPFFRIAILLALSLLQLTRKGRKNIKKFPTLATAALQCNALKINASRPLCLLCLSAAFFFFLPHTFYNNTLQATQRRTDLPAQRTKYGGGGRGKGRVDGSWRLLVGAFQTPGAWGKQLGGVGVGLLLRSGGSRDRWARVAVEGDLGRMRVLLSGRRGGEGGRRNLVLEFLGCAKKIIIYKYGGERFGWGVQRAINNQGALNVANCGEGWKKILRCMCRSSLLPCNPPPPPTT